MVGLSWIATGRAMIDDKEYEYDALPTGSGNESSTTNTNRNRLISPLSRVMRQNHDYERLQGIEEGTGGSDSTGGELEELVFETNQL